MDKEKLAESSRAKSITLQLLDELLAGEAARSRYATGCAG
jgi:hypothetical protein